VNLVNLESAVKSYGQRALLDGVSAGVATGDSIGLVGRNGTGKSTLLALLAGTEQPDTGRVTRARDLRVGHLAQTDRLTGPVAAIVVGDRPEHEWAGDARVRSVITALLSGIDFGAQAERLSGGETRRVALASLLIGEHDLLLLDEPTNHLDVEAIAWLAGFLRDQGTAMVVVTHDRWFLDAATTRTWELADGRLTAFDGGYAAYVLARAERDRIADASERRRQNLLRKELAWLQRGPPARTSKPRFRIDAANALIADVPAARDGVELARLASARLGKTVIDAVGLSVRAGDRVLISDVDWQLGPGDRIGVIGANGSGKTTLLRVLAGVLRRSDGHPGAAVGITPRPDNPLADTEPGSGVVVEGSVTVGKTVRLGFLAQDGDELDPSLTAREAIVDIRGNLLASSGPGSVGFLLERMGVRGETQFTPVGELSGGERRRIQMLRVLIGEPNVLFLDEPTNDLDVDTLTEVEDLLDGWAGSLLVVSHDRYFLERVTDHVVALLGDGKLSFLAGGIDEYLELRARRDEGAGSSSGAGGGAGTQRAAAPGVAGGRPARAAGQRQARKDMQRLERQIDRLAAREKELHEALAANASDYARLISLGDELRGVQTDKERLEEEWLEAAEEAG
jgi:ATP-binding cassette subfamily F protein uup